MQAGVSSAVLLRGHLALSGFPSAGALWGGPVVVIGRSGVGWRRPCTVDRLTRRMAHLGSRGPRAPGAVPAVSAIFKATSCTVLLRAICADREDIRGVGRFSGRQASSTMPT